MLGKTVRVPRHVELSEPGWRRAETVSHVEFLAKACTAMLEVVEKRAVLGFKPGTFTIDSLFGYYFGHHRKCNVFVASCIVSLHFLGSKAPTRTPQRQYWVTFEVSEDFDRSNLNWCGFSQDAEKLQFEPCLERVRLPAAP
jgi:hypothetical protein